MLRPVRLWRGFHGRAEFVLSHSCAAAHEWGTRAKAAAKANTGVLRFAQDDGVFCGAARLWWRRHVALAGAQLDQATVKSI